MPLKNVVTGLDENGDPVALTMDSATGALLVSGDLSATVDEVSLAAGSALTVAETSGGTPTPILVEADGTANITGSVSISGTPSVTGTVAISGTPAVTVSGTVSVDTDRSQADTIAASVVATSTSSTLIAAARAGRVGIAIRNMDDTIAISIGASGAEDWVLNPGDTFSDVSTAAYYAVAASGTPNVNVWESYNA